MSKDSTKMTDMERAYNGANILSGYKGPSTVKQQDEMTAKYGTAPTGKELYTIKDGKAIWKTPAEIEALSKNLPDYSTREGRAEIEYNHKQAVARYPETNAQFLQTLNKSNSRPAGTTQPATTQPATTQPATTQPATTQPQSTPNPMMGILNPKGDVTDGEMTETFPSFYDNFDYLKKLRKKQITGSENPFDSIGQQAMV